MHRRFLLTGLALLGAGLILTACAGPQGPAGPVGPAGPAGAVGPSPEIVAADLSCTECHNNTTLIVSKEAQFRETSIHGTGESFERGEEPGCAGCHGTEGAVARIAAGLMPHDESIVGIINVSPFDCRTCHQIHTTYTSQDWALTGNAQPVALEMTGGTFDGGQGNLCTNCHQIRNAPPTVTAGNVEITSSRFGTHHGVEAAMLLGEGGLGVAASPSSHYQAVENTCVACHMGAEANHTYLPDVARCQACHADAEDFDIHGVRTEITALVDELTALFIDRGMMDEATGLWIVPATYPEAVADAMWNYTFVVEDQSMGVHNSAYTRALLNQALEALQ